MSDNQFEGPENLIKQPSGLLAGLRNSFLTGLVVIAPVALTIWLIWSVIGWIDGFVLPFIPNLYHPDNLAPKVAPPPPDPRVIIVCLPASFPARQASRYIAYGYSDC